VVGRCRQSGYRKALDRRGKKQQKKHGQPGAGHRLALVFSRE
jgi:hypothetical protein